MPSRGRKKPGGRHAALEITKAHLLALGGAAQDAIVIVDDDGSITFWSDSAERIFGHAKADALGKNAHDLLAPASLRPEIEAAFTRWRGTGRGAALGQTVELSAVRKDGREFPIELSLSATKVSGRWNAIGIIRDITERRRADEDLKFRNILLDTQQEASLDGILVVDDQARILSFNRRFVEMWEIPETVIAQRSDELALKAVLGRLREPQKFLDKVDDLYKNRHDVSREEIDLTDGRVFDRYSAPIYGPNDKYYGRIWYFRDMTPQRKTEDDLRQANDKLSVLVKRLEERSVLNSVMSEMWGFLQACATTAEIGPVIGRSVQKLFPRSEGALYFMAPSKTDLEPCVRWGGFPEDVDDSVFHPDACWGLRKGVSYIVQDIGRDLVCGHIQHRPPQAYACLPLIAKGDVLGLLHVRDGNEGIRPEEPGTVTGSKEILSTLSELLSLSISNIKLRETLSSQSFRDPLTGLFNRRYMEEGFQREIYRAARCQTPIAVIMADVDHFKAFNDAHGHPAGDRALVELATSFRSQIRASDIACRYGGEEFALILPDCSLDEAGKLADRLVGAARTVTVQQGGRTYDSLTVSLGIAAYPEHGQSPEELLQAADRALYRAKQEGRDRVVTAPSPPTMGSLETVPKEGRR